LTETNENLSGLTEYNNEELHGAKNYRFSYVALFVFRAFFSFHVKLVSVKEYTNKIEMFLKAIRSLSCPSLAKNEDTKGCYTPKICFPLVARGISVARF